MKVCTIIIPCYDDSASLDLLLPKIREARLPVGYTLEILVINDTASPDVELEEICGRHKAELLTVPFHMGHQEAVVFGIRHCVLSPAAKRAKASSTPGAPSAAQAKAAALGETTGSAVENGNRRGPRTPIATAVARK